MGFFSGRRLRKQATVFWELARAGEIAAACELYASELAADEAELSPELRATYRLLAWIERPDEEHEDALRLLAEGEESDGPVAGALVEVQRRRRAGALVDAIRLGSGESPPLAESPDEPSLALERLALAVLDAQRVERPEAPESDRQAAARRVRRRLPPAESLEGAVAEVRHRLEVWARWTLGQHLESYRIAKTRGLAGADQGAFFLAALYGWARDKVEAGEPDAVLALLDKNLKLLSPSRVTNMTIRWAEHALERGAPERGTAWLSKAIPWVAARLGAADPGRQALLELAFALCLLAEGKHVEGGEVLGRIGRTVPGDGDVALVAASLSGLSALWTAQAGISADADDDEGEARMQVRSRWRTCHPVLHAVASRLEAAERSPVAWRGHLLRGLLAYVDSSRSPDPNQLRRFSAATGRVPPDRRGVAGLKAIETALITRVRATDEAAALIRNGRTSELRDLHERVLVPLGTAIPTLVRVAVVVTLWDADRRGFDPLATLHALQPTPEEAPGVAAAVRLVETVIGLDRLAAQCAAEAPSASGLPDPARLDGGDPVAEVAALATAAIRLRRGEVRDAGAALDARRTSDATLAPSWLLARFRVAWDAGDAKLARRIVAAQAAPPALRTPAARVGVSVQAILDALSSDRPEDAIATAGLGEAVPADRIEHGLVSFVTWQLGRERPELAGRFVRAVRGSVESRADLTPIDLARLRWVLLLLDGLCAARSGQHGVAGGSFEQLLRAPAPPAGLCAAPAVHGRLLGWARLFRIGAELALAAAASVEDVRVRLPALRRTLEEQAARLTESPTLRAYGHLIGGLVSFLGADVVVEADAVARLDAARRSLATGARSAFLDAVIGRLDWRRQLLESFWQALTEGDFKKSLQIFKTELEPGFGANVPASIQLGMVLVDAATGSSSEGTELIRRLAVLEDEAPELDRELFEKAREYVLGGQAIRELTERVRAHDYDGVIEFCQTTRWPGHSEGAMPIPVAIALQHAHYKKKQDEDAIRMGEQFRDVRGFEDWVRDYGRLILGYVLFDNKEFEKAAEVFGELSEAEVLGHDVDRYWAAAHFSHGVQLLGVEQKAEAFEAFARSVSKRQGSEDNRALVPLFVHFGMQNLEERHGSRALQAFELLEGGLADLPDSPDLALDQAVARIGVILCQALLDEVDGPRPDEGTVAVEVLRVEELPEEIRGVFERVFRKMAVCQALRLQGDGRGRRAKRTGRLVAAIQEHVGALERLEEASGGRDPVLRVLQGMFELRIGRSRNAAKAMDLFGQAASLGVRSRLLTGIIERERDLQRQAAEQRRVAFTVFDHYLASGAVPATLRESLVRNDDVAELYRLNRSYRPSDIAVPEVKAGVAALRERIAHLETMLGEDALRSDARLVRLGAKVKEELDRLAGSESKVIELEKEIMRLVAAALARQMVAVDASGAELEEDDDE